MANEKDLVFLISEDDTLLILDVTRETTYQRSGAASSNTLQDGVTVSDHYHPDLPTVTISGSINTIKIRGGTPSPVVYVTQINKLMDSQKPFTLYGTIDSTIPSLDNCVILDFSYVKTGKDSLDVNLVLKQIDFGMRATLDSLTPVNVPSKATGSTLAENTDKKTGTKTLIDGIEVTQLLKSRTTIP
ncbi:P2 gpU-like protein [Shewanella sp. phage 1/40]|uniref:endolysin n=1 Tax=Shewanella sp. phage 1/40 TaxID=1458860 RepID=UPI0004F8B9D7|nr:endolysin [Shewanella sp. phage 1/40]AHK11568.1 P2 gpU-like protein [Shewanella sp. phage 1/40]